MKTKRSLILSLLTLALVIVLSACNGGGKSLASGLDLKSLADEIQSGITFRDKDLGPMPDQLWDRYIDQVDQADITSHYIVSGGGATAEEIVLFEAKDQAAAERVEGNMEERYEYFRTAFGNYTPEELVNVENPALVRSGNYVFGVLSDDNPKAKEIIEGWIEKNS